MNTLMRWTNGENIILQTSGMYNSDKTLGLNGRIKHNKFLALRLNLSYRTQGQGRDNRMRWRRGELGQASLIIAVYKDLMDEWVSTIFLRSNFLILSTNLSLCTLIFLSIKVYFFQFVYYSFWYLFSWRLRFWASSDEVRRDIPHLNLLANLSDFGLVSTEFLIIAPKAKLRMLDKAIQLGIYLIALPSSLVPTGTLIFSLTDPNSWRCILSFN